MPSVRSDPPPSTSSGVQSRPRYWKTENSSWRRKTNVGRVLPPPSPQHRGKGSREARAFRPSGRRSPRPPDCSAGPPASVAKGPTVSGRSSPRPPPEPALPIFGIPPAQAGPAYPAEKASMKLMKKCPRAEDDGESPRPPGVEGTPPW